MTEAVYFVLGMMAGGTLGVIAMCIFIAGGRDERN